MNEKQINAAIDKINKARAAKRNPLTRVKVSSPSMATGKAPTSRLVKRRKKTERAPKGVYANPGKVRTKYDAMAADQMRIMVYEKRGGKFNHIANFDVLSKAKEYAQAYADAHNVSVEIRGNFRVSKK